VSYFNNYLYDPKRPQNPEIKPLMSGPVVPPPAPAVDDRRSGGDFDRGGGGGGYNRGGGGVGGGWNNDRGNAGYGGGPPRTYGGGSECWCAVTETELCFCVRPRLPATRLCAAADSGLPADAAEKPWLG
jgi:hypothetical protein